VLQTKLYPLDMIQKRLLRLHHTLGARPVLLNEASAPTENPWLANWYMTQYRCKLPGVTYTPYVNYGNCVTQTTWNSEVVSI
jgi:hypothetical protein